MTQKERLYFLNSYLLTESPQYRDSAKEFDDDEFSQFRLFRSLVNVRPPREIGSDFLKIESEYLKAETKKKGIVFYKETEKMGNGIYLFKGDITTLKCDAIVNAANSKMLGCFCPCHSCIDNAIHTFSGVKLRLFCDKIMTEQGFDEETGNAKITPAFNLPSKFIIHTVGPIVFGDLTDDDCEKLKSSYEKSLKLADEKGISSIAFCCISTGEFHFPNEKAGEIAVKTVIDYKEKTKSKIEVIFNVFKDRDYDIYRRILG